MSNAVQRERADQIHLDLRNTGRPILVLVAMCICSFLIQFDLTALAAGLPDIASSFSTSPANQVWVIDIYSLALIFTLPLTGPLADRYGRQRIFLAGALLFAASSVLCAAAPTFFGLLAGRALQGLAGAALTASGSALLAAAYPGPRRAWAFGISGTVIGASMVVGPPLGAFIAAGIGWQWIFWINAPICVALMVFISLTRGDEAFSKTPLDWVGPAMLASCVGLLAFVMLAEPGHDGPYIPKSAALIGSVALLALFLLVERRHAAPAFDLALFGSSRFVAVSLVTVASSIGYWALLVHLPQMARGPMSLSPMSTGFLLTALTVPMLLLPSVGAKLVVRMSARRFFTGGLAIVGAANLLLAGAALDLSAPAAVWAVVGALLIGGCGTAMFNSQISAFAVSAVPPDRAATASAISVTARQIGFAFGIALIGSLLRNDDPSAYTAAFTVVSAFTFGLALLAFVVFGSARR